MSIWRSVNGLFSLAPVPTSHKKLKNAICPAMGCGVIDQVPTILLAGSTCAFVRELDLRKSTVS